tara:strand:+ start:1859 stop:2017 length:159 start_codon:yes stop_codon:yes gene_type:complete
MCNKERRNADVYVWRRITLLLAYLATFKPRLSSSIKAFVSYEQHISEKKPQW